MFSGVKFIARSQIDNGSDNDLSEKKNKAFEKKKRHKEKKKCSGYSSSDDDVDRIKSGSRKKKWYSSEECLSEQSTEEDSEDSYNEEEKKHCNRKKTKNSRNAISEFGSGPKDQKSIRKEIGLEWMLRPTETVAKMPLETVEKHFDQPNPEETVKLNPKELNPYLKDNVSGYPENADEKTVEGELLLSSVVGDGGASWRLKALKRAREQAAREGRNYEEVIQERWGSVDQLASSAASHRAAPSRAHLDAIRSRRKGKTEELKSETLSERDVKKIGSRQHSQMRAPKARDSLSWRKQKSSDMRAEDTSVVAAAVSRINKFSNDGSFLDEFRHKQSNESNDSGKCGMHTSSKARNVVSEDTHGSTGATTSSTEQFSSNYLAAKALQLRMKGKTKEADKLLQGDVYMKAKLDAGGNLNNLHKSVKITRDEADADADTHLARSIIQNRQFSISGQADYEYDSEGGSNRKRQKKGVTSDQKVFQQNNQVHRIMTQQERCLFCFENPGRPKHLVVSIGNLTYLMLPQWQPVVMGHCCILTMQHESATRNVDNNVWDEIRNFKKCLITMFDRQDKELVFLETVMGLAQQRRHCLIECIPIPRDIAKQAPLYFKKAIDEAEDEWSQHNAKKLIDTSVKGLRGSIPKNFPYFHVEFGLDRGFVHVIDDEKQFKSSFGLNVIRGMLRLAEEDMHRRRRHESVEAQKQSVASFAQAWEPFDWTKQLD